MPEHPCDPFILPKSKIKRNTTKDNINQDLKEISQRLLDEVEKIKVIQNKIQSPGIPPSLEWLTLEIVKEELKKHSNTLLRDFNRLS